MTKIVYVSEGLITWQDLEERDIPERIKKFEALGINSFEFIEDRAAFEQEKDLRKANLRLEKEGPNWVRQSPDFLEGIQEAEIIILHYSAAGKLFFDAAKKLKLLCVMRSGVENVDMDAAKEHGVTVCFSPGRASEPVADFTLTLLLSLMRKLPQNNMAGLKKWKKGVPMGEEGMLQNATVGLFGFGMIAQKVALRLKGFGCKILAYDPWVSTESMLEHMVTKVDSLGELFEVSDYVSVHARLTEENYGIVNSELLGRMKPTSYLINTARAGLINEEDLIECLKQKGIAGAGLDVFNQEPLPENHPFLSLDNVIVTPHVAGNGGDFILRSIESPLKEIEHYLKNEEQEFQVTI